MFEQSHLRFPYDNLTMDIPWSLQVQATTLSASCVTHEFNKITKIEIPILPPELQYMNILYTCM